MIVATWNVQGLTGKMEDIISGLQQMETDIAVLSETKRKGDGISLVADYIHIHSGVPKSSRACKGISILIHKKYRNHICNWNAISERLATVNLNIQGHRVSIIAVYAPNEDAQQTEKDEFYDQLNDTIAGIGNHREIILLGDFNARTGNKENSNVIGKYGEKTLNLNGNRLIEVCEQYELKILNGFFQHKNIHKYTWHQDTRGLKSIIDYVIVKQKTKWSVQDTRVYRGIECGSDHYLLASKFIIPYKTTTNIEANAKEVKMEQMRYNLEGLGEDSIRTLYQARLDTKLNDAYLTQENELLYQHITESLHSAAFEALGLENKHYQKHNYNITWNSALEEQKTKKQYAYKRWLNTKDNNDKIVYKHLQREFKQMITENKNVTWERRLRDLDSNLGGTRSSESWKLIKSLKTNTNNKSYFQPIQLDEWQRHYTNELTENREEFVLSSPKPYIIQGQHIEITEEMIHKAIKTMKNKKAAGPEGLPAELLKNGTEKLIKHLKELLNRHVNGDTIPKSWKEAWITPIHKKGPKNNCGNYRCISVTSTMSRLYGKVLRNIIEDEFRPHEIEQQAGFRAGRSCIDHIFSLVQVNEKRVATNREVHLLFVDLTKAYDTVPVKKLWQVLEQSPINNTVIKAIQQLYEHSASRVKLRNTLSDSFEITKGLRQGCCLSPTLFKIYLNEVLKNWRRACSGMGIQLNQDTTLYTLHFADDQVVIAQDKEDLEFMARRLFQHYEEWGLSVNTTKTQYLCVGGEKTENLQIEQQNVISSCMEYNYLGTKMQCDGRTEKEIEHRIMKGKQIIGCLNSVLWSKQISRERKHLIYQTVFVSMVLYGCEAWQMNKTLERRLLTLEMDFWRRAAGKSRLEKIRNEQIREIMRVDGTIIDEIQRRQLKWYGHVERMDEERIPKQILKWTPTERRKRGRPKPTWMGGIQKAMSERNLQPGDWENRRGWRLGIGRRRTL